MADKTIIIGAALAAYPASTASRTITLTEPADPNLDLELYAPSFTLASAQNEYPPVFDPVTIDAAIPVEVCNIRLQGGNEAFSVLTIDQVLSPIGDGDLDFTDLADIVSGENFFRFRIENPVTSKYGPWSIVRKHGDVTAPTISGSASVSELEGTVNPTGTVTADETVTWEAGGAAAALVSITSGPSTSADWTINETTDYDFGTRSYAFHIIATDLAGNVSEPFEITYSVLNNVSDDPPPQWSTISGANKSSWLTVSGSPPLVAANDGGTGNLGSVRARAPTAATTFQVETTINSLPADSFHVLGVDDGSLSFAAIHAIPGQLSTAAITLQFLNGYQAVYCGGNLHETSLSLAVGDVVGYRCDTAGSIEFYCVRGGVYTTIWTQSFTPFADWFGIAGVKAFGSAAQLTTNFGATSFARALSAGYTGY